MTGVMKKETTWHDNPEEGNPNVNRMGGQEQFPCDLD